MRRNGIFRPVAPASRKNSATTDQPHAASVPSEISVSIVAAAWRKFFHATRWKGQAPQRTTGVVSANAHHCQYVNWRAEIIPRSSTGNASTAEAINRRRRIAAGSSDPATTTVAGKRAA